MGVYDIVKMRCPRCYRVFAVQTKVLFNEPGLRSLRVDSRVDIEELMLLLKNACDYCKCKLILVVHNYRIVTVCNFDNFKVEGMFGSLNKWEPS